MTNINKAQAALSLCSFEELNSLIPYYKQLLKSSKRVIAADVMSTLLPGDSVELNNIRPRNMNGSIGKVIRLKQTKVLVEFPGTQWASGVTVPASCLTKVDSKKTPVNAPIKAGTEIAIIAIFADSKYVLKKMAINVRLHSVDWQSIKHFDFGELGYDYEEGLRLYVPLVKLADALKYLRSLKLASKDVNVSLGIQASGGGYHGFSNQKKGEAILASHKLKKPAQSYMGWAL